MYVNSSTQFLSASCRAALVLSDKRNITWSSSTMADIYSMVLGLHKCPREDDGGGCGLCVTAVSECSLGKCPKQTMYITKLPTALFLD